MNSLNSMRIAARPLRNLSRGALPAPTTTTTSAQTRQFLLQQHSRRLYSSEPPSQPQSFKKTFSRPIFKVALMAIFTYQLAYYGWKRLEQNETREDLNKIIAQLEQDLAKATIPGMKEDLQDVIDVLKKKELEEREKANQKKA
ncbi:hypothetical protein PG985_013462 [Apiospora marii]|uniref:Inner membrane assembly complex subunit 17 n=1 Tax=Apiospora marii TaxID=335849 RepID=A0ABR1R7R7_9PEZI